jgi:hypothetical protein
LLSSHIIPSVTAAQVRITPAHMCTYVHVCMCICSVHEYLCCLINVYESRSVCVYMCIYVCYIYIYIHTHTHTHPHTHPHTHTPTHPPTHTHPHTHIYIYIYRQQIGSMSQGVGYMKVYTCMCTHMHVYTPCMYTCMHVYMHAWIHTQRTGRVHTGSGDWNVFFVHTCIYVYIHLRVYCIHTYIHTYIYSK